MIPVIITETALREPRIPDTSIPVGITIGLSLSSTPDIDAWYSQISDKRTFTFRSMRSPGYFEWYQLRDAIHAKKETEVRALLQSIAQHTIPSYDDRSPEQKWDLLAQMMPHDIGGFKKEVLRKEVTAHAAGKVLEVMCGFNSYVDIAAHISEVVALDYSKEMLLRYPHPERKRILFDMEHVALGQKMDFFAEGEFNTICCCFGTNYLSSPVQTFKEFNRILAPQGTLLTVDNTTAGYSDLILRHSDPEKIEAWMKDAHFKPQTIVLPDAKKTHEVGDYFMVVGTKE